MDQFHQPGPGERREQQNGGVTMKDLDGGLLDATPNLRWDIESFQRDMTGWLQCQVTWMPTARRAWTS